MSIYPLLRTIWIRERKDKEIVGLDTDFFEKVRAYITHLETQADNESDDVMSQLFKKRWQRAKFILHDLINIRVEKHIRDTLAGIPSPDKLPHEEKRFRIRLEKLINEFHDEIYGLSSADTIDDDSQSDDYILLHFLENDPLVTVGSDLLNYGPFMKGDFAFVPVENAKILIKKAKAERIGLD